MGSPRHNNAVGSRAATLHIGEEGPCSQHPPVPLPAGKATQVLALLSTRGARAASPLVLAAAVTGLFMAAFVSAWQQCLKTQSACEAKARNWFNAALLQATVTATLLLQFSLTVRVHLNICQRHVALQGAGRGRRVGYSMRCRCSACDSSHWLI